MTRTSPISSEHSAQEFTKALDLLADLARKSGKDGGHRQGRYLQAVSTISMALGQLTTVPDVLNTVRQQAEVAISMFRSVQKTLNTNLGPKELTNGDDGTSETAGK